MYKLVLHHTYIGGSTFDVSGKGNHGNPTDVVPGTGADAGSYGFTSPTSGIMVPSAPSLENLNAIRIRMKIRSDPWDGERRNLMEGFVSFAFVLEGDGSLAGTVVDANGVWDGLAASGVVTPGRWHEVEMLHDGVSTFVLKVDGQVVAMRADVPGPVRSVGPLGVAIGRWPDANQYVFKGNIGETQLWRFDPVRSAMQFLDCCCGRDAGPLEDILTRLRERGMTWEQTVALARDAQQAMLDLVLAVRGAGDAAASELDRIIAAARLALLRRDRRRLADLRTRAQALIDSSAGPAARNDWEQRITVIMRESGLDRPQLETMLRALCLDLFAPREDTPRPDPGPTPRLEGGPWDDVRTPDPLTPPERMVD